MKIINRKPVMVSTAEAAAMYPVAAGSLQNWRSKGTGPKFYKVNRKVAYRVEDLETFFTQEPVLTEDSIPKDQR